MKLWLKYVIGIGIGLVAALILPVNSVQGQAALEFVMDIVVRIGRYMLVPMLFFSIATACYKLREENKIFKTGVWTFGVILVSSVLLVTLGLVTSLVIELPRIPITIEKVGDVPSLDVKSLLTRIFPYSGFQVFSEGAYLLPCFVFAGLIGAGASSEKNFARPTVTLFDSLSRVFYNVMSFFTEILAVGMIAVMCKWTVDFIVLQKVKAFMPLIMMLAADLLVVVFVVYPVVTRFLCHDKRPWRVLYAGICPFMVSFFSGDTNLTLPLSMRHGHESLGINRRTNSVTFPLFAIFGRGGAALVQAVCFVQILRSYSMQGIDMKIAAWIGIMSLLLSFVLVDHPVGGPFFAITLMCMMYGPSFEAGYLLIKDAAPIICAFAAAIDTMTALFGSYIVAVRTNNFQPQEMKKYI